jgi:hypothetical protein
VERKITIDFLVKIRKEAIPNCAEGCFHDANQRQMGLNLKEIAI